MRIWAWIALASILMPHGAAIAEEPKSIFDENWKPPVVQPVAPKPSSANPIATTPAPKPPTPGTPTPGTPATDVAPIQKTVTKWNPPDSASQADATKLVKQVFEKEYGSKSPDAKRQLAAALLGEAEKIRSNYIARFVLLREAQTALSAKSGVDDKSLVAWAVDTLDGFIQQDRYAEARRLAGVISSKVSRSREAESQAKFKAAQTTLTEHEKIGPLLEKLKTDSNDPAANFACGKFYCLFRKDWARGLPMLAKGSDAKLKELAGSDLAGPKEALAQFELAGKWWDGGKEYRALQAGFRDRACHWYEEALPSLGGLERALAERRLAEAAEGSPHNILRQMVFGKGTTLVDGNLRLTDTPIATPMKVTVPFKAEVIAQTDSTNIRLGFNEGEIIFNWEYDLKELRCHDPVVGKARIVGFKNKGTIPVNEWVQLTWIVEADGWRVYANGEERGSVKGDYKTLAAPFTISPAVGSVVTVKSVVITPMGK